MAYALVPKKTKEPTEREMSSSFSSDSEGLSDDSKSSGKSEDENKSKKSETAS